MKERKTVYRFDPDVLEKMDEFEREFLGNAYKKDTSENNGPNYRERIARDDTEAFEDYLESDYSEEFLNLK